jgi:hypothetical protein
MKVTGASTGSHQVMCRDTVLNSLRSKLRCLIAGQDKFGRSIGLAGAARPAT